MPLWWDSAVLLVAVAIGALITAVLAVAQPALPARLPSAVVWVAAAGGVLAMALAGAAPTGWEPFDLLLRAVFGALVPLAAARAGWLSTCWLLLVSIATLFIALEAPYAPVAGVAAGAFWALVAAGSARPATAAIAAAFGTAPMAYVEWPVATGASAAAFAVAALPVLLVGLLRAGRPLRGRIALALAAVVVLLGLSAAAGLASALSARTDIDRAVDLSTSGIELLGDDDERARADLRNAAGAFGSAEEDLTVWWARPALAVPGVAQQARAVATMASAGADLARTAADASEDADIESIRPRNGRIDLDALTALQEPLARSVSALRRATGRLGDIESPVLLSPIADRLQTLQEEVEDALGSAELATQVVDAAPALLGSDAPRRYFVSFQNPAEQRGNGGFMGNWAELTARDGVMTLTRSGRILDLRKAQDTSGEIDGEEEIQRVYGLASRTWGIINFSPDNPSVSRMIAQLYPLSGGAEIDGVLTMTPAAVAGFLELTGPVEVAGYPDQLTSENVQRIMLHEQYLEFPQETNEQRIDFLTTAVENVFDRLLSIPLPGPTAFVDELGPAVESRDLQLWSRHEAEQQLFAQIGADGDMSRDGVDSFGVVTQNYNGNKIDWFLQRDVAYGVTWAPQTGEVTGTLQVAIENQAPATGLPSSVIGWGGDVSTGQRPVEDGENLMGVALYSTFPFDSVRVDGVDVAFEPVDELGHHTARFFLSVPPRGRRVVTADLAGQVVPGRRYVVRPLRQPSANPDTVEIRLSAVDGWMLSEAGEAHETGTPELSTRFQSTDRGLLVVDASRSQDPARGLLDRLRG